MVISFYPLALVGLGIKVGLGFVDSHDKGFCFLNSLFRSTYSKIETNE
jgi:hypothetical protein